MSRTFAEGPEHNRALGIFGAAAGTAAIAGSDVGGLLVGAVTRTGGLIAVAHGAPSCGSSKRW